MTIAPRESRSSRAARQAQSGYCLVPPGPINSQLIIGPPFFPYVIPPSPFYPGFLSNTSPRSGPLSNYRNSKFRDVTIIPPKKEFRPRNCSMSSFPPMLPTRITHDVTHFPLTYGHN